MAEVVGGALLSAIFQGLFDQIASRNVLEFIQGKKCTKKSLQRLKTTFLALKAVLNDAEQKQISNSAVKDWLDDLKGALYHADDLMDEISTTAAARKKVGNFFSQVLKLYDRRMGNRIEGIIESLESILKYKDILHLREITLREKWFWRPQSTSLIEESDVCGRDNDREFIVNLLTSDNSDNSKISVIPIVGMGGIGKTTLAQVAYNDDRVKENFDLRAWVCISEEFDISRITNSIIEVVTSRVCENIDLNSLQLNLKEKLIGKKFLIVLDDIWNENYDDWDILQRPFQNGMKGSKILVTTRSEKVASIVQNSPTYHISQLSDEDCWSVFAKHAFLSKECDVNSNLEEIGRKIVKKCKGLPLVAKTLGGLLRLKHDIGYWNTILKSDIWYLPENESKIIPALRISYHYLSSTLKQCFVYCSVFPKDYEFEKNELILLWMAEGLLQPPTGEKSLEEVGEECFHDLVSRSFFQRSNGKNGRFVMHDLIHDLAMFEARGFHFRSERWEKMEISSMTRHIYSVPNYFDLDRRIQIDFEDLSKAKFLRTLVVKWDAFTMRPYPLCKLIPKLKCLRVLSYDVGLTLEALPDSINELIHLRYLDFSFSAIKKLPETLCDLYNLQTLILERCYNLTMLPSDMHKLLNLRYLNVRLTNLKEMPRGIGKLKNLQFLSDFVVGKDAGANIRELGELKNLHRSLRIGKLQYGINGNESLEGMLMDTKPIEDLLIEWSVDEDIIDDPQLGNYVLRKLQPHKNLKYLFIKGYRGSRFPNWLGSVSYYHMSNVNLVGCKYCSLLPPLGQLPSLKRLSIEGFDRLEHIGVEFCMDDISTFATPFPALEYLGFRHMHAWQEWDSIEMGAFPKLSELILYDCSRLRGVLPKDLPALETLRISMCRQLASSIPLDNLPNLKGLYFKKCENLKTVSASRSPLEKLQCVTISHCTNLVCFAREGLRAPNMASLKFTSCHSLTSLPDHMNAFLPELQVLQLSDCPQIEAFPPKGGLPPNLSSLVIDHCLFCRPTEWYLPSLTVLQIKGYNDDVQCFSEQCLLFPSLATLQLWSNLTLETLDCKAFVHLTSLQNLDICNCPQLEKITGERLPASLKRLRMFSCPLLEELCYLKHQDIWSKISHIPSILFEDAML